MLAKTVGGEQNTPFDLYKFEPDARYECIIKFFILGRQALDIFLNKKNQKKKVGSKRVFISFSLNNTQTSKSQVSISIVLADRFGHITDSEYRSFVDYVEVKQLGSKAVLKEPIPIIQRFLSHPQTSQVILIRYLNFL